MVKNIVKNVDWLLSEAFCLFDEEPKFHAYQYQHQTVKEASMIAQDLKVKNLLIWHTEDQTGKKRKERYTEEAKQFTREMCGFRRMAKFLIYDKKYDIYKTIFLLILL